MAMPCGPAQSSMRNREWFLDLHVLGIDHRNCVLPAVRAVDWNVLIKFSGLRTPPALLEAVGGFGVPFLPSNMSCANDFIGSSVVEMKVTKGGVSSAGLAIMIRLSWDRSRVHRLWLSRRPGSGSSPPQEWVYARVRVKYPDLPRSSHSSTQTFPGLSPTQSSVLLLAVNTPSGPEVSLLPVKPANPVLTNCVSGQGALGSTTSIALLLRSARKYLLSTGSNQLMSNEKNVLAIGRFPARYLS